MFGPTMTDPWASYSNLLFNHGLLTSSLCGRPSEVRVTSIIQASSNPFVKARQEARGIYLNSD